MLAKTRQIRGGLDALLSDERIRQAAHDGRMVYSVQDVVAVLCDEGKAEGPWENLKESDPELVDRVVVATAEGADFEAVDASDVIRLAQRIDSPRASRVRQWVIESAVKRLEESDDPELALLRTRQAYEQQGYSRQWIDQRMRSVSARHELAGEWYRRGVRESEQFRALTNEMMQAAFGMDVETYRRYKGLFRTRRNLRDHMTDLELAMTSLAETTAVEMARQRRSRGFEALLLDARNTGRIIAGARGEIERQTGRRVVSATNDLPSGRDGGHDPRPPHRPAMRALRPSDGQGLSANAVAASSPRGREREAA